jgi:hypothetical protein
MLAVKACGGGLVVSILASGTQVRGLNQNFSGEKILSIPFSEGK